MFVGSQQSISNEEDDNNSDYEIRDEDQDISMKEDTKEDKDDEDKKDDNFYFCNKKNKNDKQRLLKSKPYCSIVPMYFNGI